MFRPVCVIEQIQYEVVQGLRFCFPIRRYILFCLRSLLTMSLKDKVALVTGAAQGLGRGFAEILLKNGAKVAFLDLNETLGKDIQDQFNEIYGSDRTQFYPGDVTSDQQFKDVFQKVLHKFGRIDIVCNNAGILNEKDWEKTVSINLCGMVRGTYLALDHMKKQRGGQGGVIVNVASLAGLGPLPGAPVYTATKHGVVGFSRALASSSLPWKLGPVPYSGTSSLPWDQFPTLGPVPYPGTSSLPWDQFPTLGQ
ncbi:15-hydroxyprostaglandin dehydrogenase [NAD(+)]-like isoform X2 [Brachyhypopomus gauderio]|uniref:15-hydroxyprostaglandin dehydrogenase [NAD(+)]-like isoform X2 n=1 Tax=Brachyhypopomus gauderio TaxID=698409 RepID=UPI0040435FB0